MFTQRMKVSIAAGAVLGIVCIVGASIRSGFELEAYYLLAFWYNRLLMGVVIGLAGAALGMRWALLRGGVLGLLVSLAFYSATNFHDPIGFFSGILYGVIIEYAAFRYGEKYTFSSIKRDSLT